MAVCSNPKVYIAKRVGKLVFGFEDCTSKQTNKQISLFQTTDIQGIKGPYRIEILQK